MADSWKELKNLAYWEKQKIPLLSYTHSTHACVKVFVYVLFRQEYVDPFIINFYDFKSLDLLGLT